MTESDLAKIKFKFVMSLSGEYGHYTTYESVDNIPAISICIHTPVKEDGTFGRQCRRYRFRCGGVYKSKKKFLEAVTAFEEERKSKLEKK